MLRREVPREESSVLQTLACRPALGMGHHGLVHLGAADWYISHFALAAANLRIPHNPESWLARLAQLKQVPVQERPLCKLPFVSVRFVHNASALGVVVKRRHYQAARDDDRCWATRNGSGGWSRCSDAESMRSTLETMRICPKHPCGTR